VLVAAAKGAQRPGTATPLRLSGSDADTRPQVLTQMLHQLAVPDRSLADSTSMLEQELADIEDHDRRRILLLVGSYVEAKRAAEYLNAIPEWTGRITLLVSDDAHLDNAWRTLPSDPSLRTLSRGNVASFAGEGGQILVAPLLAVERGHNIVNPGKAAIGSVYFLARPHPRPDDIALAIQAINDWAVRQVRGPDGDFRQLGLTAGTPDLAGLAFRREARRKCRFLTRQLSWTTTPPDEKIAFTWDQFVVMWQVIGRLVRGGVEARVVFVDAAFSPREAGLHAVDTSDTSLLVSMRSILDWTDRPDFCGDLIFCLTLLPGVAHLPCQKASSNSSGGRSPHQECNRLAVYLGWDSMLPTIGRRRPDTSNLASTCTCVCAQTSRGCFRLR
jgi:hypothetical protein